uniref:Uncharacterized protein n=1 Tax=Equus asinus TaxID=9793 RepID=A0A9L0J0J6_EQUAS
MMKLWFPPRNLLNSTNLNRPIPSYILHIRHNNRLLICYTHLVHILHLPLYSRRTRPLLQHILTPSSRPPYTNVNLRTASQTPMRHHWPTRHFSLILVFIPLTSIIKNNLLK